MLVKHPLMRILSNRSEKMKVYSLNSMLYNTGYKDNMYSFVNNINVHDDGTHEEGIRLSLTRVI